MSDYEKKLNSGKTIWNLAPEGNKPAMDILSKIKATIGTLKRIEERYDISLIPTAISTKDLNDPYELRSIPISDIIELLENLNNELKIYQSEQKEIEKKLTSLKNMNKNLQDECTDIDTERTAKLWTKTEIQAEIAKLVPPKPFPAVPSGLDRFLADKNPGFFKSIAMNFFSSSSIDESRKKCIEYDSANSNNMKSLH